MWFKLEGTRSSFQAYADSHGHVVRKPRTVIFNRRFQIWGRGQEVEKCRLEQSCNEGVDIL